MSDTTIKAPTKRRPMVARDSSSDPGMLKLQIDSNKLQNLIIFFVVIRIAFSKKTDKSQYGDYLLVQNNKPIADKDLVDKLES